jgi:hypothetical protein
MYSVVQAPLAAEQIRALPRAEREKLRRTLEGIAATARDVLLLQSGVLAGPAKLVVYLGEHVAWYELDHERRRLTVEHIEALPGSAAA